MSDYFFYDLNKKMADLANKQQLTEDAAAAPVKTASSPLRTQLNERDLGKHNNATTGFAALAKKTGGGEKGARIAGAQLAKMRAKGQVEEGSKPDFLDLDKDGNRKEPMRSAARSAKQGVAESGPFSYGAKLPRKGSVVSNAILKRKEQDKNRKPIEPTDNMVGVAKVTKGVAEGMCSACNCNPCKCNSMEESALQAAFGKKKYGDQGMKALQKAGRNHASDATMNKIRNQYDKYDESRGIADEGNAFSGAVAKAKQDGVQPGEKIRVGGKQYPVKEQGAGIPTTPKQKAFAKLAPPVDKITFADKIVGAKKEVDEVLGDVAANAMKKAIQRRTRDMEEGSMDDDPFSRKSSTGGRIDTTRAGVTRHHAGKSYSGAGHDAGADDTPSGALGRRKVGAGKGTKIGAKINTGKSKLMTKEGDMDPADQGEYDQEGSMAKDDIKTVVRHAQALEKILGDNDNLPEWVQAKLAKIEGMMTAVDDYMQNQQDDDMEMGEGYYKDPDGDDESAEDKEDRKDNEKRRREEDGKKVTRDIEYDEKKKDGIHGKRRDSEDNKAERAGKKVAKDIEYDEKVKEGSGPKEKQKSPYVDRNSPESKSKIQAARDNMAKNTAAEPGKKLANKIDNKKKEVDETTTSGSVATGSAAPKSGGGMSYGKGIYDSMNREVEKMISESMSINMSMNNDSHGGPSNTLTVTATDEDALQLAMLLRSAGLGSQEHNDMSAIHDMDNDMSAIHDMDHGHGDETCPACGSSECECDSVDEAYGDTDPTDNQPDYPTNQEGTDDAMMYSGGLNGPKSTGQTTSPIVGGQDDRMGYAGTDALRRMMEMAGLSEAAATPQDVPEDPPTKPAAKASAPKPATTKPPVKLATPQAVDEPVSKVKESLLMQLRNFKY
jgi:hypothetical protein